jgi:hypothetical protein
MERAARKRNHPSEVAEDDVSYYRRRANEESAAAQRATNARAAHIHQQLAAEFAGLADRASKSRPKTVRPDPATGNQIPEPLAEVRQTG